jgi:hypothetical protein
MLEIVPLNEIRLAMWCKIPGLSALEFHPADGSFGRYYFPAVYGDRRRDVSFAISENDEPLLLAIATVGESKLDWFGRPLRLFLRADISAAIATKAVRAAFGHLDALVQQHDVTSVRIRDKGNSDDLSAVGEQCLIRQASARLCLTALADLSGGEAALRKGLRKSFKSLINWGRRNLSIDLVGHDNTDRALFDSYQAFHLKVAGHETRSQASWDTIYAWISAGGGELVLGSLDGELVSGTLVLYGSSIVRYGSGVYDRARFDKPLTHWPLWFSMLRSVERGFEVFDIGDLPLAGTTPEKEIKIGYFKRGFATRISTSIEWHWEPHAVNGINAQLATVQETPITV